jgi:hypothetical protein
LRDLANKKYQCGLQIKQKLIKQIKDPKINQRHRSALNWILSSFGIITNGTGSEQIKEIWETKGSINVNAIQ